MIAQEAATRSLAMRRVLCHAADRARPGRTDVVTLANGDRITGEVVRLERGRLEFKTDDAGTLYLEWDKLLEPRDHPSGRGADDRWPPIPGQPRTRPPVDRSPS